MTLAQRLRSRDPLIGYWISSDNPVAAEVIAGTGYDYVCLDLQHGLIDYSGCVRGLTSIDAAGSAGIVRPTANNPADIGRALDAGAHAVIVPLVNSADEANHAARACRYPPHGIRSYGPTRARLRFGPAPRDMDAACIVMIETRQALDELEQICAVPGVDAVYVGPSDLSLALGADDPAHAAALPDFAPALERVRTVARTAGIAAGMHCTDGVSAARALADGFTFATVSNDLNHLGAAARDHLTRARDRST